jgi:hypothetical protein
MEHGERLRAQPSATCAAYAHNARRATPCFNTGWHAVVRAAYFAYGSTIQPPPVCWLTNGIL